MDQTQLQQKIAEYYTKLPTKAQQLFSSMTWMEALKKISVTYGLNANQIETLGTETTLVLLGIIDLEEYEQTVMSGLSLPRTTTEKLVAEIDETILKSIRPDLENAYSQNVDSLVVEKYGSAKNLDKRFAKLPSEVQKAINESNYQVALYTIAQSYNLTIIQMGALEEVTNKVLLGIIHPDTYESEVQSKIGLSTDKATELVGKINEQILKNIRGILRSHWESGKDDTGDIDDEVPIPPYAVSISPVADVTIPEQPLRPAVTPQTIHPQIKEAEKTIYQNAGIEIVANPPFIDITKSIIGNKLKAPILSTQSTSDHSAPKIQPKASPIPTPIAPTTKAHDPYHEVIE